MKILNLLLKCSVFPLGVLGFSLQAKAMDSDSHDLNLIEHKTHKLVVMDKSEESSDDSSSDSDDGYRNHGPCRLRGPNKSFYIYKDAPTLISFSSERLNYTLYLDGEDKEMFNLLKAPQIRETLFAGGSVGESTVRRYLVYSAKNNRQAHYLMTLHSDKNTHKLLSKVTVPELSWKVTLKNTGQVVGELMAQVISGNEGLPNRGKKEDFYQDDLEHNAYINLAYCVAPEHQRQGYATEMSVAMIQNMFSYTSADVIVHNTDKSNIASSKAAQKVGFLRKGKVYHRGGEPEIFRIIRKETLLRKEGKEDIEKPLKKTKNLFKSCQYSVNELTQYPLKGGFVKDPQSLQNTYITSYLPKLLSEGPNQFWGKLVTQFPKQSSMQGSAVLVGPRHVITAGHYLYNHEGDHFERWAKEVIFTPGIKRNETPYGTFKAEQLFTFKTYTQEKDDKLSLGMILLDKPIGETLGWCGIYPASDERLTTLSVTGYPRNMNNELMTQSGTFKDVQPEMLTYKLDSMPGQGGGGIWTAWPELNGSHAIVGVHGYSYGNFKAGVRISLDKFNAILKWMQSTGYEPKLHKIN